MHFQEINKCAGVHSEQYRAQHWSMRSTTIGIDAKNLLILITKNLYQNELELMPMNSIWIFFHFWKNKDAD